MLRSRAELERLADEAEALRRLFQTFRFGLMSPKFPGQTIPSVTDLLRFDDSGELVVNDVIQLGPPDAAEPEPEG